MPSPSPAAGPTADTTSVSPTEAVDAVVHDAFGRVRTEVAVAGPEAAVLVDAAERATRGGKALRARLCLAAATSCGGPVAGVDIVSAAAALELFQAAALVHDDLMDSSDTRRGEPSTHRFLERTAFPASPGHEASSADLGRSGAILTGDLLLTLSATVLASAVALAPHDVRAAATATYSAMSSEVAVGQFLDLFASWAPWDGEQDEERAWRVVHAKSARYSVELPLRLGAVLAGADDDTLAWFARVGTDVGTAFQLRDDLLGVFGDPARTGKPAGDDLREGKRTVLVAWAHQATDDEGRALLTGSLGNPDLDATTLQRVTALLESTGARTRVEDRITELADRARAALTQAPDGVTGTDVLDGLLRAATDRAV